MDIEISAELKEEMYELLEELYIEDINLIFTDCEETENKNVESN